MNNRFNISIEQVHAGQLDKINAVYEIIKTCGENMLTQHGLRHWATPLAHDVIEKSCINNDVYLAKDTINGTFVTTFQIEYLNPPMSNTAKINKFATLPSYEGKGISGFCIDYIENICKDKNIETLCLDVYDKNVQAISFYTHKGFTVIGNRATRNFTVVEMIKYL